MIDRPDNIDNPFPSRAAMPDLPTLPVVYPVRRAADYWDLLRANVPSDIVEPAFWERLAPAAPALHCASFGLERMLDSARVTQWGCHIRPWHMEAALDRAARFPRAALLAPLARAWLATPQPDGLSMQMMVMWDEEVESGPPRMQAFLSFAADHPGWRDTVRAFAGQIDQPDVAAAWLRCAAAPHAHVAGLGVYPGRRDMPVRVTLATHPDVPNQWPGHPNQAAVAEIGRLAGVPPYVAVLPAPDPGLTWHVPVIVSHHPKPHEALAPLIGALRQRGLVDADTVQTLRRPPLMIPVPDGGTLDGQPALLRLMVSLERIKVVVERGEWISAKACYLVRPVWRAITGQVLVES